MTIDENILFMFGGFGMAEMKELDKTTTAMRNSEKAYNDLLSVVEKKEQGAQTTTTKKATRRVRNFFTK
jgi:hypothetical protein